MRNGIGPGLAISVALLENFPPAKFILEDRVEQRALVVEEALLDRLDHAGDGDLSSVASPHRGHAEASHHGLDHGQSHGLVVLADGNRPIGLHQHEILHGRRGRLRHLSLPRPAAWIAGDTFLETTRNWRAAIANT